MTIHYSGEVWFSKPITEEQQARVKSILEKEELFNAYVEERGIYFEEGYNPEDAIREIQEYLATSAENPVELDGKLGYWGDYEGGLIVTPEGIENLDSGPFYIRADASDEELIAELTRRGYAVTKKEESHG